MPDTPTTAVPHPALPCAADMVDDFLSAPTPGVIGTMARATGPFLILGASGKLGLHLALMLRRALQHLGRADRVIAVSRFQSLRDRAAFEQRGIESIACDLGDSAAVAALPESPTVFFLAGVKFGTAADLGLLRAVNVEIPQRIARRFAHSRIVAFSSGNVYPFVSPASGGAREDTPASPVGAYAMSCVDREQAFSAASASHDTPVVLVRLNYATEFRYGLLVDLAQWVFAGHPIDVTTGYVNVIWQSDAIAHSIQALELASAPAALINVTGPGTLSVRDLAHRLGRALGRPVAFTGTEAGTALLNNAALSHRRFGAPLVTLDQMIAWTAAWVAQGGATWGKPTGFERRDGRF
ncbi:MAG: NAD(P)-dependent oxidoreductase [Opitutaceae bacterium]|nr:NAD(P)-dependent oxidoreductase [Opitutaceae bacterium]